MRSLFLVALAGLLVVAAPALVRAGTDAAPVPLAGCAADAPHASVWAVDFSAPAAPAPSPMVMRFAAADQQAQARRPVPVEYSDAYKTRAKIHKISSFATLPLFVANYLVGQDLYNNPGDESMKGAHVGLVTGTAVLFGVNTVTGAWNLWEGRKDPNHRKLRMTHGILMIAADVGFLATAALAPESEYESGAISQDPGSGRSTHRAVALTSMGVATFSYLLMLFGGR